MVAGQERSIRGQSAPPGVGLEPEQNLVRVEKHPDRLTGIHGTEGLNIVSYARERCPWTRIIVLTAYGSPDIEKEAYRLGADSFLHKPIPLPDVAQIVFGLVGEGE